MPDLQPDEDQKFKCQYCGEEFDEHWQKVQHLKNHHSTQYKRIENDEPEPPEWPRKTSRAPNWAQKLGVVADLKSLRQANYRAGSDGADCEHCTYFAPLSPRGVTSGICSKYNWKVAPEMVCDDFELHGTQPKVV